MKIAGFVSDFAVIARVLAQTPNNFSVHSSLPLTVHLEPTNITLSPAQLVSINDVASAPSLGLANASIASYVAFMIDPTSSNSDGTYLHWFLPNLVTGSNSSLILNDTSSSLVGASYMAPTPPSTDNYAHEYVILLYQQPVNWAIPSSYSSINPPPSTRDRIGFDIKSFQQVSGLGSPVGTNFYRLLNGTSQATSSLASVPTGIGAPASRSATLATTTQSSRAATVTANAAAWKGDAMDSSIGWIPIAVFFSWLS